MDGFFRQCMVQLSIVRIFTENHIEILKEMCAVLPVNVVFHLFSIIDTTLGVNGTLRQL